jgi:hypothetical protein
MTGLLPTTTRPGTRRTRPGSPQVSPDPAEPPRTLLASGLTAAVNATGLGLLAVTVLVLLGWATAADSGADPAEALQVALQVWLVGHGTALAVPGGRFSVGPLGLTALPVVLLYLTSARAARAAELGGLRQAASLTAVIAGAYAVLAALLALLAGTDSVQPMPVSAFLAAGALAVGAGGAGAVGAVCRWRVLWRRIPGRARLAAAGGAAALAVLLAGGALVAAASLGAHHGGAVELMRGLDAGVLGGLLLFLTCVLYLPNAVVWSAFYVAGPGFALGAGTAVAPWGVSLGAVPAFPLLAALPAGEGSGLAYGVLVIPLAAGVLGGLLADRRDRSRVTPQLTGWRDIASVGMGVGAVTGGALALLSVAAAGTAPGRLGHVGPPWWSGFVVALEIGLVVTATLVARHPRLLRPARLRPSA